MPKVKISEYSATAANNTDINGIDIAEGCAPSGINDAIRTLMKQVKDFQTGAAGDSLTVGGAFNVTGSATLTTVDINGGTIDGVAIGGSATGSAAFTTASAGTGSFTVLSDGGGNVRQIPQSGSFKTSSYTLATSDVGDYIGLTAGATVVIPNSTFAAGDAISLFNNTSGSINVTCNTTLTYIGGTDADKATIALATRGVATVLFINGTTSVITGNVS